MRPKNLNETLAVLICLPIFLSIGVESDSADQFTVSGDLSFLDTGIGKTSVIVSVIEYDESGKRESLELGSSNIKNGRFVIESEIDEPRVVDITISMTDEVVIVKAVVEPRATITITSSSSWIHDLVAKSGAGKHLELVESWQQGDEYMSIAHEYKVAYQKFHENLKNTKNTGNATLAGIYQENGEVPKHQELMQKLRQIRYDALNKIASNAKNPIDALLALELGAFARTAEALPIYDKLVNSLDKDLVARRVAPAQDDHLYRARVTNDNRLVAGQKVFEFSLPNVNGERISLSDILSEKEYVLVDFWGSWCAPCIATFPALKDLYSAYGIHGFEIASICIDESRESWIQASEEQDLPWNNLGESEGWTGETVVAYGANIVPKSYLIDSNGRVVLKDFSTERLKEFLIEEYGEVETVDESKY